MKKQSKNLLKELQKVMAAKRKQFDSLKNSDNPQIKEIVSRLTGELEAYANVIFALQGNYIYLNLEKEGAA